MNRTYWEITKIIDGKLRYMNFNGWGTVFWTDKTSIGADNVSQIQELAAPHGEVTIKQVGVDNES